MSDDQAQAEYDAARLISDVRAGDPRALTQAYQMTFGSLMGRLVLADFMKACGVGAPMERNVPADDRHYQAGRHDAAIDLLTTAGYDQAALVVATMGNELEERTDEDPVSAYRPMDDDDSF